MLRYIIGISVLTLGIIIVRALSNGKVLRKYQYAFWIAIPLYMILMPFVKIDVPVADIWNNIFTSKTETTTYDVTDNDSPAVIVEDLQIENDAPVNQTNIPGDNIPANETIREQAQIPVNNVAVSNVKANESKKIESVLQNFCYFVSAILVVVLIAYNIGFISYCKRKRKYLGKDPLSGLKIYGIKHKETPFLMFNKIYIDDSTENISEYIIYHEACHYKHGDYLWVLIRYLVLFLNWYNPVIWAAFILSGRDCELACDEAVMKAYGSDSSKEYARTLLEMLQLQSNITGFFALSTGMKSGYEMMKKRIIGIKRPVNNSRKALAFSMAAILLFTSCSFVNTSDARKIRSSDPWYDTEVIEFEPELKNKDISFLDNVLAGVDENNIVVYTNGSYRIDQWTGNETYDDWSIQLVTFIDRSTKEIVKTINLYDLIGNDYPTNVAYADGKLIVMGQHFDSNNKESDREYEIDFVTSKVIATRDFERSHFIARPFSFNVGEYRIEPHTVDMNNPPYCSLAVIAADGTMTLVDAKDSEEGVYYIPFIFALDNDTALIAYAADRSYKFFQLDLPTCKLTSVNADEYSWLDIDNLNSVYSNTDGEVFFTTSQGISKLNLKNKTTEEFFNYDWSNVNRSYTQNMRIAECTEDSMLLAGRYTSSNMFDTQVEKLVIVELTKANKNPHAGKTIIELYIPNGEMNEVIADAIIKYKETNSDYFIHVTNKYDTEKYIRSAGDWDNKDERDTIYLNADAQVSYELAMDIINGEGPDIMMNTSGFGQLNNDNCLIDLSPYIADLDPNEYFTNIIDGARTDGKLYQLPISFTIEGIQTDPQNAGKTGIGFTTEEYESFLYGPLNGKDIIESGQLLYFSKLFDNMSDVFIKNGKADFTGPEFRELAEYVNDNVRETSKSLSLVDEEDRPRSEEDDPSPGRNKTAYYCNCPGISGYLVKRARMNEATAILGIPSADGRGPMYGTNISVAVSSHAVNSDACISFVKMLLSDEVQSDLVLNDNFVLNRNAFRHGCEVGIDYFNSTPIGAEIFDYSIGTTVVVNSKFTTEDIDNLENIILSCSKIDTPDASINLIILEEMPAYFSGQKDLASVVKIMQDRVQKVLDERG